MSGLNGQLRLEALARAGGRTALAGQECRSPFHVGKPYWHDESATLIVQVVNATAGILAGDTLTSEIAVGPRASLLVTTPSANRVYRMNSSGAARSSQLFTVAAGGWLEVLPEPLVPHRNCRYDQRTKLEVSGDGAAFYADLLLPGRIAHGEAWGWDRLCLETEVRRDGELILRERFEQTGVGLRSLAGWSGSGETACFGNAILVSPPSEALTSALAAVSALHGNGLWIGVSALRRGGWSIKFVAPDGLRLRDTLRAIRAALAPACPRLGADPRKL